jgi:hypothetical protein
MYDLYRKLEGHKGNANWRNWPIDETRLSSELKRLIKPLRAVGITCNLKVDRRGVGGTQKDLIITYTKDVSPGGPGS